MPRYRDSLRLIAILSSTIAALSVSAADEPAAPVSGPAPAQAERPPLPPRSDTMAADLLRQLPAAEFVSLKAGADEFVALWRPANVGSPKGVIVLLPGEGETADWPRGIGPLRRGLPDAGWHTLSLSLPDSPSPPSLITREAPMQPPADETVVEDEQALVPEETAPPAEPPLDEAAEEDPTDPALPKATQDEQITERIEAALAFARSKQPAVIVLLGQGTGGYWAARHLQQLAPADIEHLLVIQPRQPEGQDEPLAQLIPTLKLATGDFYYKEGSGDRSAAQERLNASRRLQHPAYRQVGLPPKTGEHQGD